MTLTQRAAKAQIAKVGNTTYRREPMFVVGPPEQECVVFDVANCTVSMDNTGMLVLPNNPDEMPRFTQDEAVELAWDILRATGAVRL